MICPSRRARVPWLLFVAVRLLRGDLREAVILEKAEKVMAQRQRLVLDRAGRELMPRARRAIPGANSLAERFENDADARWGVYFTSPATNPSTSSSRI